MPGTLYGPGHLPLMAGTVASDSPGDYLPPVSDKSSKQLFVFIINDLQFILAETTDLFFPSFQII